jgi:hypothetical protein
MATKKEMEFPRINFVALLAGALFLVSIFLYWWGIDTTGSLGVSQSSRWSLWSGPSTLFAGSGQSAQTLTTYSPYIGAALIASTVLVLLGTIPKASRLLAGSAVLAILVPILYAVLVNYSVSNSCGGMSNCITGPFGTQTITAGPLNFTENWGFQPGFYIEIVGAILSIISVGFHRTYLTKKSS